MVKIILSGCLGRMGKAISRIADETEGVKIVCGLDKVKGDASYPVYTEYNDLTADADVIIDFSHPDNLSGLLEFAKKNNLPIVAATTGLSDSQREDLKNAASQIPVFFSANMSLGINLLIRLSKVAAGILEDSFDIEIVESHHNKKIDAPSGTALAIADGIAEALKDKPTYVYDRQSVRRARDKKEIGIHAIRGGTVVGEHEVMFLGNDEIVTLSHSARSRDIFAQGAVSAAKFLAGKPNGYYTMDDLFDEMGV